MKKHLRKLLAWIMTLCIVLSMAPAAAMTVRAEEDDRVVNGYYNDDGQWVQGGDGTITHNIDGTDVTLSKTAQPVAGKDNVYEVTLQVKTSTSVSTQTDSGAVVLVIDVSGSMDYCSECGESKHDKDCGTGKNGDKVQEEDRRITAAKNAALDFLESYAGTDSTAVRQLAIVTFASGYSTVMGWTNVAGGAGADGYDTAVDEINDLNANGGTNLEGGLYTAKNLLDSGVISGISSKSVVLLTDGVPTYSIHYGDGMWGSEEINDAAAGQATGIKNKGATLYTVCFGVSNEKTYNNGPTVGAFLRDSVASSGCNYDADNADELATAFKSITEDINSGLSGEGWTVDDPMPDNVSVTDGIGENFYEDGNAYTWKLSDVSTTVEGNTTYYVYTYKYEVTFDPQAVGFEEGAYYPINERTYLNIGDEKYEFPVPGVTGKLPRTDVTVTKVWDDNDNQDGIRTESVTVQLKEGDRNIGAPVVLSEDNGWTYTWNGVEYDLIAKSDGKDHVYTVEEVDVPDGYKASVKTEGFAITVTNSHEIYKTAIEVTKVWEDENNQDGIRPDSITVNLLADGEKVASATLTAEDDWKHTFDGLEVNRANGTPIEYVVEEEAVEGYATNIDGYVVTNTHEVEKISIPVTKVWEDAENQDGIRPNSIVVTLLANGQDTGKTLTLTATEEWSGSFTDLDKYSNANAIEYIVAEAEIPGYISRIEGSAEDGYAIINTHTPETVEVAGSKTWDDNNNQDGARPASITINLVKNGEIIDFKTVTAADGWAWNFTDLPKNEGGVLINYSITENEVEDYSASYNGYNVTNTHTPAQTSVTVTKSWQDNNDQDGIRPNDITVNLLANGADTGKSLTLSDGNNWTGSFTDLDKYAAGAEIVYTVAEVKVEGYETVISGSQSQGYTITNSYAPETVDVAGSKIWDDNNNQDGARPESITINLLKNGAVIDTRTVTANDGWAWNFTNLPKFENKGTLINYSISEAIVEDYSTSYNGYNVTNTHTPAQTSVTVTKSWQDNNDQDGIRPNDITVELVADGEPTGKTLVLSEGNNWTGSFTELDKYAAGEEIDYTVAEVKVEGYETVISGSQADGYTITNSHTPATIEVAGSKTWDDNNNQDGFRPASITINLLKNGEVIDTKTVTANDGWAWSFTNLPKYENHGNEIEYTITENAVEDYSTTYNGYNVTNAHTPEETSVTVTKSWQDNNDQDGIRPNDITVELVADGEPTGKTLVLSEGNNWTGSFTELDKYAAGEEIDYTVAEVKVEGYETVISGSQADGYTITNSHTPATIEVAGSKTWEDNEDQDGFRPVSITINLLKNGEVIESEVVTEADGWAWSFTNLPKYENHGNEIEYTITENAVEDYSTSYDGYNVINKHTPEETSVTVTKSWKDNNDQDGIRPNTVTVELVANGEPTGDTLELNEANNWTGSFTELNKYKFGKVITYTVAEVEVEGYETVISGSQADGYTITNSHTPATIEVAGSKTWEDNNNQDGARPASITIHLLKNGEILETQVVTEADGWAWSFNNLPKYENQGTLINYSITEEAVEDYSTTYNGYNVVNVHTPEETSVTVTKAWLDNNDQDGIRPNSVTIHLYADGVNTGLSLVLNEGNNWTGSFTELNKYENGEPVVYTVLEDEVPGYATVITGNMVDGYVVTNAHTPATVVVAGAKLWVDNYNQDGIRPESITIHLLKNGRVIDTRIVTAADGWAWAFAGLPMYENHGDLILYAVVEQHVDGYVTVYNGFNVVNTHIPEKTSVTVTKAWDDNNDQDGIRPNEITVALVANGKDTGLTLVLNEGNNWTDSFHMLDKFKRGEEIVYTVKEVAVEGYETVITGNQYVGYTLTNIHTPETVEISGSKIWDDNNNQDGFRPESITINLLKNGQIVESKVVTEADGWAWNFTNLAKYENHGSEIVYAIVEEAVEDYSTSYDGYNVINKHTPEQVSVTVTKAWADNNDQDGIRPEKVKVVLVANGDKTFKTLTLSAENNWTDSFTELDKFENGVEISYTVEEIAVDGYVSVIDGNQTEGYVITNSHTPETVEIAGSKVWEDNDDQDGVRPESITINLLKNGKVVETKVVTEADGWAWSFNNLPKYENQGAEVIYVITENAVDGYTTVYDGYDVTNAHTPDETSVTVTKAWVDSNDADGIRPDSVTIYLFADGANTGKSLTLTKKGNWTGTFTELPKYANGEEIVYTVEEEAVKGYNAVIRGDMVNGFVVTNSHTYVPQTGDDRNPVLWMLLMVLSSGAIVTTVVTGKKRRYAR